MQKIKGLIVLVLLAIVGVAVSGCAGIIQVSAKTPVLTVSPASPIIAPGADHRFIRQYFSDRSDTSGGDLYVGKITRVELHPVLASLQQKRPLQPVSLTFASGVSVLGGYLQAGQHIEPGCQALLFTEQEIGWFVASGPFSKGIKPIMGFVLDKVQPLSCS